MRFAALALILSLTACATVQVAQGEQAGRYIYRLGPGDRLKITIYGEDKLSGEYQIGSDGRIAMPLLGPVLAAGGTPDEFRNYLRILLERGYLREPKLSVEIMNLRPIYVLGEVAKPGEYGYADRMTVMAAVAKAGGFSYRANRTRAFIRHENEPNEQAYGLSPGLAVRPGDTVRIGERYF
jgi:polysaccharide export outer membrane protein